MTCKALGQQFSTVQLPTFQRFSMTTSVLVPDQGSVYAGGMGSASRSVSRRNGSRRTGGAVSAGGVTVTAFVHDFEAMDDAVLEQARRNRLRRGEARFSTRRQQATATPLVSQPRVSDVRRRVAAMSQQRLTRAQADFDLAQRLLAKGKTASAKILLKSALKRAAPTLHATISEQLATLDQPPIVMDVASRQPNEILDARN